MSERIVGVPIVGGPRDGELVPWRGYEWLEPIAKPMCYTPADHLPTAPSYETRRYRAYQWRSDGRIAWRYVADEYKDGIVGREIP